MHELGVLGDSTRRCCIWLRRLTARPTGHWVPGCMQCTHASARGAARGQEEAAAEESRLQAATARAATLRNQQLAQLETLQQQILADRKEAWQEGQQLRLQAATDAAALEVRSNAGVALHALGCLGKSPLH